MGFNVVVGGYFSTKRAATSVELDLWVPPEEVLNVCYSILRVRPFLFLSDLFFFFLMPEGDGCSVCGLAHGDPFPPLGAFGSCSGTTGTARSAREQRSFEIEATADDPPMPLPQDRQKARLLWLVEEWGVERFREEVVTEMRTNPEFGHARVGDVISRRAEHESPTHRHRDYLGVHSQAQEGLSWVGIHVPVGRLSVRGLCERFGWGMGD
jgi:hypothetical protein